MVVSGQCLHGSTFARVCGLCGGRKEMFVQPRGDALAQLCAEQHPTHKHPRAELMQESQWSSMLK